MSEPRTEAGRREFAKPEAHAIVCGINVGQDCTCSLRRQILAIEDEAAALERERLRKRWEDFKYAANGVAIGGGGQVSAAETGRVVDRIFDEPTP